MKIGVAAEAHPTGGAGSSRPGASWLLITTTVVLFALSNLLLVATELSTMADALGGDASQEVARFQLGKTFASICISLFLQVLAIALVLGLASIGRGLLTWRRFFRAALIVYALYLPLKLVACAVQLAPVLAEASENVEVEQGAPSEGVQPVSLPPPATGESSFPADMAKAREACQEEHEWPQLPATVEGCDVDWDDPTSVENLVVRPARQSSPATTVPALPADEKIVNGILFLEYLLSPDGEVIDVCVLRSVSPTIDAHFVEAAKKSKFSPATMCGEPVAYSMLVTAHTHGWDWPRALDTSQEPDPE